MTRSSCLVILIYTFAARGRPLAKDFLDLVNSFNFVLLMVSLKNVVTHWTWFYHMVYLFEMYVLRMQYSPTVCLFYLILLLLTLWPIGLYLFDVIVPLALILLYKVL